MFSRKLCYEEKNTNFFNNYLDNYYESNTGKNAETEQTNEDKEEDEANKENNLVEIVIFINIYYAYKKNFCLNLKIFKEKINNFLISES